ncbi:MAG: pyruvate synthase subunit beta, partial [Deltaproteobacteria bacterium]|nr:pyruvate synthase subunit beta [Deltaproteobacteria bacterium]
IRYIATCSASYPLDIYDKLKKAMTISGVKYFHIHTPCPPGWGFDPAYSVKVGKMAVRTGLFDLYEIENGILKRTGPSQRLTRKKLRPVIEYFKMQRRFKALTEKTITQIQRQVDEKWEEYEKNC